MPMMLEVIKLNWAFMEVPVVIFWNCMNIERVKFVSVAAQRILITPKSSTLCGFSNSEYIISYR